MGWDCVENRTEASLLLEQVQQNRLGEDSEMNLQTTNMCVNNRLLSLKDSRKLIHLKSSCPKIVCSFYMEKSALW